MKLEKKSLFLPPLQKYPHISFMSLYSHGFAFSLLQIKEEDETKTSTRNSATPKLVPKISEEEAAESKIKELEEVSQKLSVSTKPESEEDSDSELEDLDEAEMEKVAMERKTSEQRIIAIVHSSDSDDEEEPEEDKEAFMDSLEPAKSQKIQSNVTSDYNSSDAESKPR